MDSLIDVFKTFVGSNTLVHVETFEDEDALITLQDIAGFDVGRSFFFTKRSHV